MIHTAWIPLGDVPASMGSLVAATGSHNSEQFAHVRKNYNSKKVGKDGVQSGWLTDDASFLEVSPFPIPSFPSFLAPMGFFSVRMSPERSIG